MNITLKKPLQTLYESSDHLGCSKFYKLHDDLFLFLFENHEKKTSLA